VPYTIQAGDTLYSLQQKGIIFSLQRTLSDNPGLDPANLRVGQVICVPGATGPAVPGACPAPSRQYAVQSGDTFYSIARKFGVSVARIEGANPSVNPNNLAIGQIICIPGA
jgi:LysM repeat protein